MTMLCYLLIFITTVLNIADIILTIKFIDKWGPYLESNPLARWLWAKNGTIALILFKLVMLIFYITITITAAYTHASPLVLFLLIAVTIIYTWAVSASKTMIRILEDLDSDNGYYM